MKISELLSSISTKDLVLPEFQREYVWSKDQAKQLMVSLLKGYPVGSLLFWKTDQPPELKNIPVLPEHLGTIQVILDGQQRLTCLYLLMTGTIPVYYQPHEIDNDPRDLYYHLEDGDFQYYLPSKMKNDPLWINVVECFTGTINVFEIAKLIGGENSEVRFDLAQKYNKNLNSLQNVRNVDMTIQTVPLHASLEDAITIFDRVNSQGTKLTDADLALTHITGKWAQARRVLKDKIVSLEKKYFYYDLSFMTRALTGIVVKHALFETVHKVPKPELEKAWKNQEKILDYLTNLLPSQAFIHSTNDLNTNNVIVPIIVYLSLHGNKFPNVQSVKRAMHWLYAAQMLGRYSGQTDQRMEADISIIAREDDPWDKLLEQITDQRGRIEIKPSDFDGTGVQNPLYRMAHILAKSHKAVDWFNGLPLGTNSGKSYYIHSHHIFPQSRLYAAGYDPDNYMQRYLVNEIANRAFLTADTNLEIKNRFPADYLPEVERNYPGALANQFVPINPELWKMENYMDFLRARRNMMAHKINEFMSALVVEPVVAHQRSISDLVQLGESATLEFKSTLQWDIIQGKANPDLRKQVLKTVVAFLNSEGGTLVIGVEDDGTPFGLEKDLQVTNNSKDKFSILLSTVLSEKIGAAFTPYIKMRFDALDGKEVCVLDVSHSATPAYHATDKGAEFYIRFGPTSRLLDAAETVSYISTRWG